MKTYRILILGLMLPLANLTFACSTDDDDDAGDEQGDDSDPTNSSDGNSSGGNSSGGNSSGGNSSGGNSSGGNSSDDSNDGDDGWDDGDDGWDDDDDGASDDGPSGGDIGDECNSDDDCNSRICLFAPNSAFGFCSIVCDSWSDCPSFWDCVEVSNATRTYCAPS